MNRYKEINEITRMTGNELGIFDNIICDGEEVSSVTGFTDIIEKLDKCKTSGGLFVMSKCLCMSSYNL